MIDQKLASAQGKISLKYGTGKANPSEKSNAKVKVSSFEPKLKEPTKFTKHNSDQIPDTVDISDIKHTSKSLFQSTAAMTEKTSIGGMTTPHQETSKFSFGLLGENDSTPAQFSLADTARN